MKKTTEQMKAEFITLMNDNGFTPSGETAFDGAIIYSRVWIKEIEIVWQGKGESCLEIRVSESSGFPLIGIIKNGRLEGHRDYSTPKRAINAIREIVENACFAF